MLLRWYLVYAFGLFALISAFSAYWLQGVAKDALSELERSKSQIESQTKALSSRRDKYEDLRQLKAAADQKLSETHGRLSSLNQEIVKLRKQLKGENAASKSFRIKERDFKDKIDHLAKRNGKLERISQSLKREKEELRRKAVRLSAELIEARNELARSRHQEEVGGSAVATAQLEPVETPALSIAKASTILAPHPPTVAKTERTITNSVNVRARPNIRAALLETLAPGQKIIVEGATANKEWHRITYAGRRKGFVYSDVLRLRSR